MTLKNSTIYEPFASFYYICIKECNVYQPFILSQQFQDLCPNPVISNFSIIYGFVITYVL